MAANREFPVPYFNVKVLKVFETLNVVGNATFDASVTLGGASGAAQLSINSNVNGQLTVVPRNADSVQLVVYNGTNQSNNNLVICGETGLGKAFDHASMTDPHLWIHSETDPDSANTQWVGIWHDQTDGNIDTGTGTLNLGATGNVNFAGATKTGSGDTATDGYVTMEVAGAAVKFATVA